jgi:hypothetical protein
MRSVRPPFNYIDLTSFGVVCQAPSSVGHLACIYTSLALGMICHKGHKEG